MKKCPNKYVLEKDLLWAVFLFLCISVIFFVPACKKTTTEETMEPPAEKPAERPKVVLRSSLAGRWYLNDAQKLKEQIAGFFQKAEVEPKDNIIALILPHAGYQYSGQTAVSGLKAASREYKRIITIGPSHSVPMEELLSVPRVTHYETPLGQVPLDVKFIDELLKYSLFQNVPQAHKYEHSVQIELPLLQYSQKDFKFVPIVAGRCSLETISKAAAILRSLIDPETLVIVSSDFVHYGPNYGFIPFNENVPKNIHKLDMEAYEHISKLDSKGFLEYKERTGATICGYVPIAILLSMLKETVEAQLIKYDTSGRLTNDFTNSVSYLAVAFSGKWDVYPLVEPPHNNPGLIEQDKERLLILARKSILYVLEKQRIPQESDLSSLISDVMRQPRAAFVTLKKDGHLRGCIGDIFPCRPLYKSVIANAIDVVPIVVGGLNGHSIYHSLRYP
ncbi:MAG: AmmeMemoRadiSam system protein B [Planctomycetota bacterium]